MRPVILITTAFIKQKETDLIKMYCIRETYVKKIINFGGRVVLVPSFYDKKLIQYYLGLADGILIPGGGDINPDYYDCKLDQNTNVAEPERDKFEISLIKDAIKRKIPILGICRGCQLLAIVSGGKLFQHVPYISNIDHMVPSEEGYNGLFSQSNGHIVRIKEDSKFYKMLKVSKLKVNTAHHQAVDIPGDIFDAVGYSDDNLIEIIESKDPKYFCIGVQFHIEAMSGVTDLIFKHFIKAAKLYGKSKN